MSLTYWNYLELGSLLNLQHCKSDPEEHDETLFIVIHQVYELWFKLMLHEFDKIKRNFAADDLYGAIATLKRCRMVMKTMVSQLDVLETMTPMSFTSFRDRLDTASGFQSVQFRELEFLLGYKRKDMLVHYSNDAPSYSDLQRRLAEPSLVDDFYVFLQHRGVIVPDELRRRDRTLPTAANSSVQQGLLKLYRGVPEIAILLELMTDFDEGLQEWRYRHVKMVERTIGNKGGTGGSDGVAFLRKSLFQPVFPDLWAIRHEL